MTQEQGLPCDHALSVGHQCGLVSQTCCLDGVPNNETTSVEPPERKLDKNVLVCLKVIKLKIVCGSAQNVLLYLIKSYIVNLIMYSQTVPPS